MRKYCLFLTLIVIILSCKKEEESINEQQLWYDNIGSRTDLPFLPDAKANYFSFSFERKKGENIGFRFKASYMYARYQSYNVYDVNTRSSIASLADINIQPDDGSINPFISLTQPENRDYTVYLLPDIPASEKYNNKLLYDNDITKLSVLLRNYMAEGDVYGNVPLPTIEAFDVVTGATVPFPKVLSINFANFTDIVDDLEKVISLTKLLQDGNNIHTFRFAGLGLFPNLDNQYLFAPLTLKENQVAIIKFIPPSFPKSFNEISSSDVRYYSLGLGDFKTYNFVTISDYQLKISSYGYIYVVIGREEDEIIEKAEGLNFLPWVSPLTQEGIIVYRNLLTQPLYSYNMNLVPDIVANLNQVLSPNNLYGDTYLGDRAPTGIKMSKEAFLANFGGFDIVY